MSLQVWLPLNGNLTNYGLTNITSVNYGATINANGVTGKCYSFDGTDDRIQLSNLPNPSTISIAFWMKRNANTGTRQFMFTSWYGITCELQTNGALYCTTYGGSGGSGSCYSSTALTVGEWYHVVYIYEDQVGGKLYLNGELISNAASSKSIAWNTTTGNIGMYSTYYNGCINDFRIYDHALSEREIQRLVRVNRPGLQVWLPLNKDPNMTPEIASYRKESGVTLTEDTDGWYKVQDTTHASGGRWGIYYDFNVKPNTTYTLYVYSKSTTGVSARIGMQSFVSNVGWSAVRDTNAGAEKLTTYTWTTGSSDTIARVYLALTTTATKANDYVFYKEPRIYEAPQNQGIANVMPIDSGVLYNNNGKIGGCYFFNNDGSRIIFPYHLQNKNKFTIALWLKSPTNSFKGCSFCFESNGMWKFATYNGVLCVRDDSRTSYSAGSRYEYSLGSVVANTWTHLICSYNAGQVKIYRDGILLSTNQTSGTIMDDYPGAVASIGADHTNLSTTGYYFNGYINDFRVYDYILSTQEIKELSRGLVLHYPLNNNGLGNENLMPNSIDTLVGSSNYNTGTWRLAGSSQMTRSRVAIPDSPIGASVYGFQSVGKQIGVDASCWGIDSFPRESGVTYTVSAWGRIVGGSTTAAMLGFSLYSATSVSYGGEYGEAKSSDTEYYGSGAYDYAGGKLRSDGKWTRIWRTFTSTASSGNIYIGFNTAITGDDVTLQLCGVKLEKGNSATPWCPNVSDTLYTKIGMNSNIVYDISGFNNNGTITGALSTSSDTVRYKASTYFDGTSKIQGNPLPATVQTVSFWVKYNGTPTSGQIVFADYGSKLAFGFYNNYIVTWFLNTLITGNKVPCDTTFNNLFKTNEWNHFVVVKENNIIHTYCNGGLLTASSSDYWSYYTDQYFTIGNRPRGDRALIANVSDLRAYSTALSADDIKELYEMGVA